MKKETRIVSSALEIRGEAEKQKIIGHGARFNDLSEVLFFFREKIAPGAFADALRISDVRALINHDPNYVLGRTKAGTLNLVEDEIGLRYEIDPPETSFAKDLLVSITRGDINQSSFAFTVSPDNETWDESGQVPVRTIHKFDEIFDVSPVTYPAYNSTSVGVRSIVDIGFEAGLDFQELNKVFLQAKRGLPLEQKHRDLLGSSIKQLQDLSADNQTSGSDNTDQLDMFKRKLIIMSR